ncbi:MAG: dynamin family protein [Chromatiaceae bacterium]|jgi:GTPase SAR1 family protein|nr:dynamin family protein [Chromatiaceae bacterium]
MHPATDVVDQRLKNLEAHLEQENEVLLSTVQSFRVLDKIAYGMGLLEKDQSFATQIPWWPLISILGTFSAGKSTFINHFLGDRLQRTGNQAVDDRFTVICYSRETTDHALPGIALDSDPRFPFYQISKDIELVSKGEGDRIDTYLQLKTSSSERLRGKILIDSPGFDADAQRTATLRITDHIIDLSDLVLVFFDARHPEPGAMRDTLKHLVSDTINRPDAGKFLYVLNQLDTSAREDNPEDVVAAWQRALGEEGLTAGRFYTIYNPDAATPIDDEAKRIRYEAKRDEDLREIHGRMQEVEVERAYRIVGALQKAAADISDSAVPLLQEAMRIWRSRTLVADGIVFGLLLAFFLVWSIGSGHWRGLVYEPQWLLALKTVPWGPEILATVLILSAVAAHAGIRRLAAKSLMPWIRRQQDKKDLRGDLSEAFGRNTRLWRPIFARSPVGWGAGTKRRLHRVTQDANLFIQTLNDRFTNPSGDGLDSDLREPDKDGPVQEATDVTERD